MFDKDSKYMGEDHDRAFSAMHEEPVGKRVGSKRPLWYVRTTPEYDAARSGHRSGPKEEAKLLAYEPRKEELSMGLLVKAAV